MYLAMVNDDGENVCENSDGDELDEITKKIKKTNCNYLI